MKPTESSPTSENNNNRSAKENILNYFPLKEIRKSQEIVLKEIDSAIKSGSRIIILEAPVGSGKSAIAMTVAKYLGKAHIITPRKSLQDQYYNDFSEHLVLMKGRNSYPCTIDAPAGEYFSVVKKVTEGKIKQPPEGVPNCADAPCRSSEKVYKECTKSRECPYKLAILTAQQNDIVVHNFHSFIFQSKFSDQFDKRDILIIDEAHEVENMVREFNTTVFNVRPKIEDQALENLKDKSVKEWISTLLEPIRIPEESQLEKAEKQRNKSFQSKRDLYIQKIFELEQRLESSEFIIDSRQETLPVLPGRTKGIEQTRVTFVPVKVGSSVNNLLLNYGEKILLMSGTIYDKIQYCKYLGINPSEAHFIRIGSSFPKANRPVYVISDLTSNNSNSDLEGNYDRLLSSIATISDIFKDAKGLIHSPNYQLSYRLCHDLALKSKSSRFVTHTPSDFLTQLENFFTSTGNKVFISPVCQQGVDFKEDRARFQIILRVPYPNAGDAFNKHKLTTDFPWFNYQALKVFGQQIGRVNRSETDFGATFLLDSRFYSFLNKNKKLLPAWFNDSIIYKNSITN